jgi:hypothetical protein
MALPTHFCFLCKVKHDAGLWYHRNIGEHTVYACDTKHDALPADQKGHWLHIDS